MYGYNVYIILSATSDDDCDSGGAEGPRRERKRERRESDRVRERELPDIVPARVLCEICSSAKIIFRPNGGRAG